jgi:hydrogenase expression/formation protein HypC
MCLSIPAKIISVEGETAKASVGGAIIKVGLHMVDNVKAGDYVLVHTGFALQKISDREAKETLKLIKELDDINKEKK